MSEGGQPLKSGMDATKFFSAVGAVALYIGLLFDFGYFWGFDLNFFMLLSYKDHLAVLAFFAVPCLFVAFLFAAFRLKTQKVDFVMCCWIGLLFLVLSATGPITAPYVYPTLIHAAFWFKGLSYFLLISYLTAVMLDPFYSPEDRRAPQGGIGMAWVGFVLLIWMFGNFFYRAQVTVNQFETEVTFAPEGKTEGRPQPAPLVRAIDNGFFMVLPDAPDRVVFVKKDAVIMLSIKVRK